MRDLECVGGRWVHDWLTDWTLALPHTPGQYVHVFGLVRQIMFQKKIQITDWTIALSDIPLTQMFNLSSVEPKWIQKLLQHYPETPQSTCPITFPLPKNVLSHLSVSLLYC